MHDCLAKKWAHAPTWVGTICLCTAAVDAAGIFYPSQLLYTCIFFFFLMIHEVILTETLCFLLVWSREFVLYFSCEQAGCFLKRREDYDMEKCCLTAYGMLCCRTMLFFLQKSLFRCHIMSFIFIFAGLFGALLNHNRNMQAVCSSTKATWHDYPKERIEQ